MFILNDSLCRKYTLRHTLRCHLICDSLIILASIVLLMTGPQVIDCRPVLFSHSLIALNSIDTFSALLDFLVKYGYLPKTDLSSVNLRSEERLRDAVAKMQMFGNIKPTGIIDNATLTLLNRKRCGVPDLEGEDHSNRVKRYALQGSKWQKTDLTWSVKHWSPHIDSRYVLNELKKAFKVWSDASNLTFKETRRADADIVISFLSGNHGDEYPFDGPGAILAHAFFPGKDIGGDAHFDADEQWSNRHQRNSNDDDDWDGVSLFSVASHEFGHSLGLSHSSVAGSLMFPYYQNLKDDYKLPYDDTLGIQQLYGSTNKKSWAPILPFPTRTPDHTFSNPKIDTSVPGRREGSTSRPEISTSKVTVDNPKFCNSSVDAIASIRRDIFVFKGKHFWWLKENKTSARSEEVLISHYWSGLPEDIDKVDAVYERPSDKKILFFIGKHYWLFTNNRVERGYPRPLTDLGLPHTLQRIDAAMIWGHNGKTYLFSGDRYWRYEDDDNRVELDYPRDMSVWKGVPHHIDAAFQWAIDGQTYFFKDDQFWRFDNRKMKVSDDSPQHISQLWSQLMVCKLLIHPKERELPISINNCIAFKTQIYLQIFISSALLLFCNFYTQFYTNIL